MQLRILSIAVVRTYSLAPQFHPMFKQKVKQHAAASEPDTTPAFDLFSKKVMFSLQTIPIYTIYPRTSSVNIAKRLSSHEFTCIHLAWPAWPANMQEKGAYIDSMGTEDLDEPLLRSDLASRTAQDECLCSRSKTRHTRGSTVVSVFAINQYWWVIIAGLLGVIIAMQLVVWHEIKTGSLDSLLQVGGDYNGRSPTCSSAPRIFKLSSRAWY